MYVSRCVVRSLAICVFVLGLAVADATAGPTTAPAGARPYTIDDLLKLQSTGKGVADPTGRWIVWEWAPPYDTQPDYSVNINGTWIGAYQLLVVDTKAAEIEAKPLFAADPARQYWLDSFSPDGRYLVFYTAKHGSFGMGSVDLQTRKVRYYDAAPDVDWFGGRQAAWLSNDSFVYASYIDGAQPSAGWRRAIGAKLQTAWTKSWRGKDVSATAVDSGADPALSTFLPGKLLKVDVRSGKVETIADGLYRDIKISHDGRYLASLRQARARQPDPAKPNLDWNLTRGQLVLFDLTRRDAGRVVSPELDVFPQTLAWADDSNRLAYFGWTAGGEVRAGAFHAVDAASGQVRRYTHRGLDLVSARERGFAQKPERVMWIGDRLALFARENADDTASLTYRNIARRDAPPEKRSWFLVDKEGNHVNLSAGFTDVAAVPLHADARSITVLADGGVWRLRPDAAPVQLGASVQTKLSLTAADRRTTLNQPFRSFAALSAHDDSSIVFIDLATGAANEVATAGAQADPIAVSPQSRVLVYRDVAGKDGDAVWLRRAGAPPRMLRALNENLRDVTRATMARISYEVATVDGEKTVDGCVLLPPDYQKGRRYPVIVDVYPGRRAGDCTGSGAIGPAPLDTLPLATSPHLLATQGYVYFSPNLAKEIIARPGAPLAGMTDATLRGVDALVAQGYADPARIGLFGVSQGGFSSLWVTTQTDRFKATVSMNGWADMYAHYFDVTRAQRSFPDELPYKGSMTRYAASAGGDFNIGKTPQQDLDAYVRNSPLFNADKVTTPVLLVHSDMDGFNLSQYEAMFTALYQQRKKARLLEYWGEGHSPSSPANIRDLWREMLGWYDQHLDVARDAKGALVWDGDKVKMRAAR